MSQLPLHRDWDGGYPAALLPQPATAGVLSDAQWACIADLVSGKPQDRGTTGRDNRLFVEAVLWMARTGASWRELPAEFGAWNTVFRRNRR